MVLPLAYGAVFALALGLPRMRADPTLLRGRTVLRCHVLFLAAAVIQALATDRRALTPIVLVFFALALMSAFVRGIWLICPYDPPTVEAIIESSLDQLLAPFEKDGRGYRIPLKTGPVELRMRKMAGGWGALSFVAEGRPPKLELLRKLLAKRFRPLFPRLRIRLG